MWKNTQNLLSELKIKKSSKTVCLICYHQHTHIHTHTSNKDPWESSTNDCLLGRQRPFFLPHSLLYFVNFTLCAYIYPNQKIKTLKRASGGGGERERERERVCVCVCTAHRKKELILGGSGQESFPTKAPEWLLWGCRGFQEDRLDRQRGTGGNHFFSAKKR